LFSKDKGLRREEEDLFTQRWGHAALLWLCATASTVLVCCAPALAARGHAFSAAFGGKGAGDEQFATPEGVAVNEATGDVYVVDKGNNRVESFSSEGAYVGQFNGSSTPSGTFDAPEGIAVDNDRNDPSSGDVYVVDSGHKVIDKFSASGAYIGQIAEVPASAKGCQISGVPAGGFTSIQGVAVDASGEVWIAGSLGGVGDEAVYNFTDAAANMCAGVRQTTPVTLAYLGFQWPGLAVDSEDDLYVRHDHLGPATDVISKFNAKGEILEEAVGPAPPGEPPDAERGLATELPSNDVYIDSYSSVERRTASGSLLESLRAPSLTAGSGVAVNSATGQVYVADSTADEVNEFVLEPPGPPTVEGQSVSHVSSDSARLEAQINPRGAATEYSFSYGRCSTVSTCASSSYEGTAAAPGAMTPADYEVHAVVITAQNLTPHTAYHFRVVAHNGIGNEVDGTEETLVTQPEVGEFALPDGRAWELVSPPDQHGALIEPIGEQGVVQAAPDGGAVTYLASTPTEANPEGFTNDVQVLSARGPSGWSSLDISAPDAGATGKSVGEGEEYRFFSEDLSAAVMAPFGPFTALSPAASEQTAYLRSDFPAGDVSGVCTKACFTPLVTGCPAAGETCAPAVSEHADVPPGTVFGDETAGKCAESGQVACGPKFRAATPDLSHIVLQSSVGLTEGTKGGLYEWAAGGLTFIGTPEAGSRAVGAISTDGTQVVFGGDSEGHEGLLMRDTATGTTVQLDAAETGCGACTGGQGQFAAASADGSRVFFTDTHKLTTASGGTLNPEEADLYECEIKTVGEATTCSLSDLTPLGSGQEQAGVLGLLGTSEDGSSVYFVANGALATNAVHGTCAESRIEPEAECNLYAMHDGAAGWEAPRLLAVLSGDDVSDWKHTLNAHTSRVSPDGEWVAFMSQQSLTGYDNADVVSEQPDEEVYLYHAADGALTCASCNPTGARPAGVEYRQLENGLAGGHAVWEPQQWLAANVPGWTPYEVQASRYQSRYLSDSGRLYFNSSDALAPQDTNDTEDVYEYEPPGVGDCTTASTTFGERSGGCVSLISSGTSSGESGFVDASANGSDVFFLTSAKLVPQGVDTGVHLYDAHECTSASPCTIGPVSQSSQPCESSEKCLAAATPPPDIFGPPASATFTGSGNVAPTPVVSTPKKKTAQPLTRAQKLAKALHVCRKLAKHKRGPCEKKARRNYGPVQKTAKAHKRKATHKGKS
jgi:DNA-binding beta-propeller fold protein YncE